MRSAMVVEDEKEETGFEGRRHGFSLFLTEESVRLS